MEPSRTFLCMLKVVGQAKLARHAAEQFEAAKAAAKQEAKRFEDMRAEVRAAKQSAARERAAAAKQEQSVEAAKVNTL